MCSISGFYDPTADFTGQRDSFLHILDEMKHCLAHRGPDDNDSLLTPHCGLAHTRLSIIDLGRWPPAYDKRTGWLSLSYCI